MQKSEVELPIFPPDPYIYSTVLHLSKWHCPYDRPLLGPQGVVVPPSNLPPEFPLAHGREGHGAQRGRHGARRHAGSRGRAPGHQAAALDPSVPEASEAGAAKAGRPSQVSFWGRSNDTSLAPLGLFPPQARCARDVWQSHSSCASLGGPARAAAWRDRDALRTRVSETPAATRPRPLVWRTLRARAPGTRPAGAGRTGGGEASSGLPPAARPHSGCAICP